MLSKDLEFRKNYENLKSNFPSLSNNILIVITAETPDLSEDAAKQLSASLSKEKDLFSFVFDSKNDPFFLQNGLLYLDTDELEDLSDNLARFQPFLASLSSDASLSNFFKILNRAVESKSIPEKDLSRVFSAMENTLYVHFHQGITMPMSWQNLMDENFADSQNNLNYHFIIVQPKTDFSSLQPAAAAIQKIREIFDPIRSNQHGHVSMRLTGGIVLEQEEMDSALGGAIHAGIIAFLLVGFLILLAYRSIRLVMGSIFFLIVSLSLSLAYATFFVGQLNLISIAFVVLFIGIGVDLAIQFCLRYREEVARVILRTSKQSTVELADVTITGKQNTAALENAIQNTGMAMAVSSIAACFGFFSFAATSYVGLAELGIIAGGSIMIAFFASILLLPAFLKVYPYRFGEYDEQIGVEPNPIMRFLLGIVEVSRARTLIILTIFLSCLFALTVLPRLEFDFDPMNLKDPETESYITAVELMKNSDDPNYTVSLVADDLDQARKISNDLEKLPVVKKTVSINKFLPSDQENKIEIIDDTKLLFLPVLASQDSHQKNDNASELISLKKEIDTFLQHLELKGKAFENLHSLLRVFIDDPYAYDKSEYHANKSPIENEPPGSGLTDEFKNFMAALRTGTEDNVWRYRSNSECEHLQSEYSEFRAEWESETIDTDTWTEKNSDLRDRIDRCRWEKFYLKKYNPQNLETLLLGSFHGRLERIKASLEAKPFAIADLPEIVRDRYQGKDGRYLITVYPSQDLSILDNLKEFVHEIRNFDSLATDNAVLLLEAGKEVKKAFIVAGSIAFVVIFILLILVLRNLIDAFLVLIPLIVAMIYTGAVAVFLDMSLNFANIIALPLLFSLGIAYGVYFIFRKKQSEDIGIDWLEFAVRSSTSRAIVFSALTTMAAFGSLIVSSHRGTSSMGLLLLIALSMALLCTFTILPALLQYRSEKKF